MPCASPVVKYYFNFFTDCISRDVSCFCVLSAYPSEKEERFFSLLDRVATVPEPVKLM